MLELIVLSQALNNPKSSVTLNEWMDEKVDNRMEAFLSVNRFLKDAVERSEAKIMKLEEQNAMLHAKLEADNAHRMVNEHLKTQMEKLEAKNDQLLQLLLVGGGSRLP